jgi:hypothetical protein
MESFPSSGPLPAPAPNTTGAKKTVILINTAITLCAMAVLMWLYAHNPAHSSWFPACPFHRLTGLYCPGCGSLRGIHLLLHGDFLGAMKMNSLMVLSLPFLVGLAFHPRWAYRPWVPWSVMVVLVLYGLLRNIPLWPFILLAPH